MTWPILVGAFILFGATIAGSVMRERSQRRLTPDQKVRLIDAFSRSRMVYPAIALGNVALFLVANAAGVPLRVAYFGGLIAPWFLFLGWTHVAIMRKLRGLDLPESYLRTFHRARLVSYGGVLLFMVLLVFSMTAGRR